MAGERRLRPAERRESSHLRIERLAAVRVGRRRRVVGGRVGGWGRGLGGLGGRRRAERGAVTSGNAFRCIDAVLSGVTAIGHPRRRRAVREHVDRAAVLEINERGAIGTPAPDDPGFDAEDTRGRCGRWWHGRDGAQEGSGAGGAAERAEQARTGCAVEGEGDRREAGGEAGRAPRRCPPRGAKIWAIIGAYLAQTVNVAP